MLIKINKTKLFNTHPNIRFAKEYNVSNDLWTEIWKRYVIFNYPISELAIYFQIKTNRNIRARQIERWIFLTEIFIKVKPARDKGAEVINTNLFGDLEQKVIFELTRHCRIGGSRKLRVMA